MNFKGDIVSAKVQADEISSIIKERIDNFESNSKIINDLRKCRKNIVESAKAISSCVIAKDLISSFSEQEEDHKVLIIGKDTTREEIESAINRGISIVAHGSLIPLHQEMFGIKASFNISPAVDAMKALGIKYDEFKEDKQRPEQVYGHYREFEYSKKKKRR